MLKQIDIRYLRYLHAANQLAHALKVLGAKGLHVSLHREGLKELDLRSSHLLSVIFSLSQAGLLGRSGEIADFLTKIELAYKNENQPLPSGKLDLIGAMSKFECDMAEFSPETRSRLEPAYVISAVKDNLELESHQTLAKNYMAMFELLDKVAVDSLSQAGQAVVDTAVRLWPGGNPTLMIHQNNSLVPVAVALPKILIRSGVEVLQKELGKYAIPVSDSSWNPHVQAFVKGRVSFERNISRNRLRKVCAGFINKEFSEGILEKFFSAVSYPGKNNTLVFVPLIVTDPLTREESKIGLLAVLKKGLFSKDQQRELLAFAKSSARMLATIQWRDELRQAVNEAQSYAESLQRIQEEIIEAERNAAMGAVAAHIFHNVKNLLLAGMGLMRELQEIGELERVLRDKAERKMGMGLSGEAELGQLIGNAEDRQDLVAGLNDVLREIDGAVRGVLSQGSGKDDQSRDILLYKFVGRLAAPYEIRAKHEGIRFNVEFVIAENDGVRLTEVEFSNLLRNLIDNAFESFDRLKLEEKIVRLSVIRRPDDDFITIRIIDNGCGISPDRLPQLFSRDGRSSKKQGFGYGLPTVKSIVEHNKGEISVSSSVAEPSRGTTFEVRFPAVKLLDIDDESELEKRCVISRSLAQRLLVFLVEDDRRVAKATRGFLKNMGFQVKHFSDPQRAYAVLVSGDLQPDLIISDQSLPGLLGHEFLLKVVRLYDNKHLPPPKLIIYSGDIQPQEGPFRDEISRAGIKWYVKGTDISGFEAFVSRVVLKNGAGPDSVSLMEVAPPDGIKDNPFWRFYLMIAHKINNLLTPLFTYLTEYRAGGEEEFLAQTRASLAEFRRELWKLQSFVDSAGSPDFSRKGWKGGFSSDARFVRVWDKLQPGQREELPIICQVYLEIANSYLDALEEVVERSGTDRRQAPEVIEALQTDFLKLNRLFVPDSLLQETKLLHFKNLLEYLASTV